MKHRDWFILLLVVAGWVLLLGQPATFSRRLRAATARLVSPLARVGDLIPTVRSRRELREANIRLQAENDRYRQLLRGYGETEAENIRLRALLQFSQQARHRFLGARVIGRDASNWWQSLALDRGSDDGVREDQPVLTAAGLVGRVAAVSRGECRVLLLIDPNCKVSATLQESRQPGVVTGAAGFQRTPHLRMTFVDRQAPVEIGQRVITAGLGGVFPKGLPVGTILNAAPDRETGLFQNIELEPAVDFLRLEEVLVLLE